MDDKHSNGKACIIRFNIGGLEFRCDPIPLSELALNLTRLYNDGVTEVTVEKC